MRNRVFACRSGLLGRVAIVAIAAATVAGCSEASRFGTPLFTGSTKNQRDIIGNEQPMPPPVSNSAISRSDLPPPSDIVASNAPLPGSSTLPPGDYVWSPDGVKPNVGASTVSYIPPPSPPRGRPAPPPRPRPRPAAGAPRGAPRGGERNPPPPPDGLLGRGKGP